jgi:hypothetical protein
MNNSETACFAFCARGAFVISGLEGLTAEAVQLAATIKKNFQELGV